MSESMQLNSECSAVKHCIKAVWEKETVPEDDDEVEIATNIKALLIILKLCRCARSARRWLARQETL